MIELLKEKLKMIWIILRYYPNKTGMMHTMTCGCCGNSFLFRVDGTEVDEVVDGYNTVSSSYVCSKCGAVGTNVSAWSNEDEKI